MCDIRAQHKSGGGSKIDHARIGEGYRHPQGGGRRLNDEGRDTAYEGGFQDTGVAGRLEQLKQGREIGKI